MRQTLMLSIALSLLAGCSRKAPPPAIDGPALSPVSLTPETSSQTELPHANTATYWGPMLESPNPQTRVQASRALQQMGKEGFPPLFKGMQSKSTEVRLTSLQAVHKPVMLANGDQTLPVLVRMLGDPEPVLRQQAAIRLGWFDGASGQTAMRELQRLAAAEQNPEVRKTVTDTIKGMELAMAGKKPGEAGGNR
jgi:HEAT repeat protein